MMQLMVLSPYLMMFIAEDQVLLHQVISCYKLKFDMVGSDLQLNVVSWSLESWESKPNYGLNLAKGLSMIRSL